MAVAAGEDLVTARGTYFASSPVVLASIIVYHPLEEEDGNGNENKAQQNNKDAWVKQISRESERDEKKKKKKAEIFNF